jgi:hypothetical protein
LPSLGFIVEEDNRSKGGDGKKKNQEKSQNNMIANKHRKKDSLKTKKTQKRENTCARACTHTHTTQKMEIK